MLTLVLRNEGFLSEIVTRGDEAMAAFRAFRPDVVLLDLMLPGKDGIDVCREIRAESGVPIVMLTARSDTIDVVVGLESGADDYVAKPFKPKELIARIRARVRRFEVPTPGEPAHRRPRPSTSPATRSPGTATPIGLTPLEFDLLVCLAQNPRKVFTREVLLEQVWGYRHAADTRLVNVHVQRLRAKIEVDPENPTIVVTVRGVGYKAGSADEPAGRLTQLHRPAGRCCVAWPAQRADAVAPVAAHSRGHRHRRAQRRGRRLGRLHGDAPDHRRPGEEPGRRLGRRGAHRDRRPRASGWARPAATTSTPTPSCACSSRTSSPAVRSRASRSSCSDRSARAAPAAAYARRRPSTSRSVPASAAQDRRGRRRRTASPGPTPGSATRDSEPRAPQRPARRRGRVDRRAALRRRHLRALLPVPDGGGAADAAAAAPGAADWPASLLLLLVAGVACLVTRQVITPVRLARRVAERIASGRLEERMHVAGEDDIARLAMSFNQMAEALQSQIRKLVELSRVQRTFVSDVSHELRTPLTTVRMAGDVLHDARDELRPGHRAGGRAAADRARPVREPARRPARDQPLRRRAPPCSTSRTPTSATSCTGSWAASRRWRCSAACR